jgi:hypothetical protein
MSKRYAGNETIHGRAQVVRYLTENYLHDGGGPVSEAQANFIVAKPENAAEISKGISPFMSNVYYVGDQIAGREGLTEIPFGDDEEDEEDDDDY